MIERFNLILELGELNSCLQQVQDERDWIDDTFVGKDILENNITEIRVRQKLLKNKFHEIIEKSKKIRSRLKELKTTPFEDSGKLGGKDAN